jgi:hypothetical protein
MEHFFHWLQRIVYFSGIPFSFRFLVQLVGWEKQLIPA